MRERERESGHIYKWHKLSISFAANHTQHSHFKYRDEDETKIPIYIPLFSPNLVHFVSFITSSNFYNICTQYFKVKKINASLLIISSPAQESCGAKPPVKAAERPQSYSKLTYNPSSATYFCQSRLELDAICMRKKCFVSLFCFFGNVI